MADQVGEISLNKLSMLFLVLGFIWILCYNAQLQLPLRNIQQTYMRIPGRNITSQSIAYANQIYKMEENGQQNQQIIFDQKYHITQHPQKQFCVIIRGNEDYRILKSVLEQAYHKFTVHYFYEDKYDVQRIKTQMMSMGIQLQKVKLIHYQSIDRKIFQTFLEGQKYCKSEQIVLFLSSQDEILGNYVFDLINTKFSEDKELKLLYTGSMIKDGDKLKVGHSYPYPDEIIQYKQFRNYPFIMGGIIAFTDQMYQKISKTDLNHPQLKDQFYRQLSSIVFGIKLLQLADKKFTFIHEPLLLDINEQMYVTVDPAVKKEIAEFYGQQNPIL